MGWQGVGWVAGYRWSGRVKEGGTGILVHFIYISDRCLPFRINKMDN